MATLSGLGSSAKNSAIQRTLSGRIRSTMGQVVVARKGSGVGASCVFPEDKTYLRPDSRPLRGDAPFDYDEQNEHRLKLSKPSSKANFLTAQVGTPCEC